MPDVAVVTILTRIDDAIAAGRQNTALATAATLGPLPAGASTLSALATRAATLSTLATRAAPNSAMTSAARPMTSAADVSAVARAAGTAIEDIDQFLICAVALELRAAACCCAEHKRSNRGQREKFPEHKLIVA